MEKEEQLRRFEQSVSGGKGNKKELIRAATVVVMRATKDGPEVLMLRKNSKIAFGGMWVFPGGRIDDDDAGDDDFAQARSAACREAQEEAALDVSPADLVWMSHWTPPAVEIRRFSTWFFCVEAGSEDVKIDDGEITESEWLRPADALAKHAAREIELVPPTWVTLYYLSRYASVAEALDDLRASKPRYYVTKACPGDSCMVILWQGDAGYESGDPSQDGARHRLVMSKTGFEFDDSGAVFD